MLNSARECPDIDLYVYFVCALAFPFRDPSLFSHTSRSPFRPVSLLHDSIPSSDALSSQLHIGSARAHRVHFPHHSDANPGAGPSRHPGADAIDGLTRPTTANNSRFPAYLSSSKSLYNDSRSSWLKNAGQYDRGKGRLEFRIEIYTVWGKLGGKVRSNFEGIWST